MRLRQVYSVFVSGLTSGAMALSVAVPGLAQDLGQARRFGPPFGPHPGAPWLWAAGLFFLLRILLITGLILIVWRLFMTRRLWYRPDGATQILRERYARGEISEDEYRKRAATLV